MKRVLTFALLTLALLCSVSVMAAKVSGFKSAQAKSTGYIKFEVTDIDYRTDLTRVYGRLVGRPHTSERIDELTILTPTGKTLVATDIDGVDFKRWFQWEDEGYIEVEIDFPTVRPMNSFTINSKGPKGESHTVITKLK